MKYVVIRKLGRLRTTGPLLGTRGFEGPFPIGAGAPTGLDPSAELRLESISATQRQLHDLSRDPEIASIAPVMPTQLIAPQVSKAQPSSWGISAVGADISSFDGSGVRVAVLDTGIDRTHAAFAGVNLTEVDFTGSGNGDRQGHGTHCAGTIFGRDVSGTRIGVARGISEALIGKVLDDTGSGDSQMLFGGMQWAINNQARVISMSIGFNFPGFVDYLVREEGYPIMQATSTALQAFMANMRAFDAVMNYARSQEAFGPGCIVVAASGNESRNPTLPIHCSLPAAAEGVVSVGAIGNTGGVLDLASFSNISCELVAPGVDITSAQIGGGLVSFDGTSMACPHAAGVAALWWQSVIASALPNRASTVMARLIAMTQTHRLPNYDPSQYGNGLATAP